MRSYMKRFHISARGWTSHSFATRSSLGANILQVTSSLIPFVDVERARFECGGCPGGVSSKAQFNGSSVLGDTIVQICAIFNLFEASLEVIGEVHASPDGGGSRVSRSLHVFTP